MIIKYLGDVNSKILVFDPSSSTKKPNYEPYEIELKEQNIQKLLPSDKFYPSKLIGHSALEIYLKGNIELIRNKNIAIVVDSKSNDRENNALLKFIDELPIDEFVFLLGFSNSYEKDLAKEILSKGFKVVFVIPCGILQLKVRKDLESLWDYENIAVLSTTSPNEVWKKYESINSLRLRLKLANITLINSFNYENLKFCEKDIKQSDNKIFYINYWNEEIDFFKNLKAHKVGISAETKKVNVLPLLKSFNGI